jgi:hypothetical protein
MLYREECTHPTLGELLPYYVVGLLSDPASVEIEEHLLDCLHCRETYLKMLRLDAPPPRRVSGPPSTGPAAAPVPAPAAAGSNVVSMADYRNRRP